MINLDECIESCNIIEDLYTKICVPSETKDVNVKAFKMIIRINEVKNLLKHISSNFKSKFGSITCDSNHKSNNNKCQCRCKKYRICKKGYCWNSNTYSRWISIYLKSNDDSVIVRDEMIHVTDSTNATNTVSTNNGSIVSINSNNKKVIYKMICHYCLLSLCKKHRSKQKNMGALTI